MRTHRSLAGLILTLAACHADQLGAPETALPAVRTDRAEVSRAVMAWNDYATNFVARADIPAPLPPTVESLFYAMAFTAVHDGLNAIDHRYTSYAFQGTAAPDASAIAAVATATHEVLAAIGAGMANDPVFPNGKPLAYIDSVYAAALAAIPDGPAKVAGVTLGKASATAMLSGRANDGSAAGGLTPYASSGAPGAYRPTPPFAFDSANLTGLAGDQLWGNVRPFVLQSGAQFMPPAPYGATNVSAAVLTSGYLRDYLEVRRLGGVVSERTSEQTAIAFFWLENSPLGWNRVARLLASARGLDGWEAARLFALVQLAEADCAITTLSAKYHYTFWRPITAIRFADADSNPSTIPAPGWDVASAVLGVPTPPVPDYPSGHAALGGAAAAVLSAALGSGSIGFSMSSSSLPGVVRRFASVDAAATENAVSRVYIGYHFRTATTAGLELGRQVGRYVAAHALQPVPWVPGEQAGRDRH